MMEKHYHVPSTTPGDAHCMFWMSVDYGIQFCNKEPLAKVHDFESD